jgi:hypothetical protein
MMPADRRPLVRPGFLKWSSAIFIMLLPFVVHAVWDYAEARRLNARLDAIVRKGEPITTYDLTQPVSEPSDAERFYLAASALAEGRSLTNSSQDWHRLNTARKTGNWTPDLVARLRAALEDAHDALEFTDRAARLPFTGFSRSTTFLKYPTGRMIGLAAYCEFRAVVRALDGDSDGALESLYSEARLARAMPSWFLPGFSTLPFVMQRTRPSAEQRARLAAALADLDRPDRLKQRFLEVRTELIPDASFQPLFPHWYQIVERPWRTHVLNAGLDRMAALIVAADKAEAERAAAVKAILAEPFPGGPRGSQSGFSGMAEMEARQTARLRCARRLVAGEVVDCSR